METGNMFNVAFSAGRDGIKGESPATGKICFPDRRGPQPKEGQTWICSLVRDTQPETKRRGAWIVRLVSLAERIVRWRPEINDAPAIPKLYREECFGTQAYTGSPEFVRDPAQIPEVVDPAIRAQVLAALAAREEYLSGWVWPEVHGVTPSSREIVFKGKSFAVVDQVANRDNSSRLVRLLEVRDLDIRKEIPLGSTAEIVAELGRPTGASAGNWRNVVLEFGTERVSIYLQEIPAEERRVEVRGTQIWASVYGLPEFEISDMFKAYEDTMPWCLPDRPTERREYVGEIHPAFLSGPEILSPEDRARLTPSRKGLAYWEGQVARYRTVVVSRMETVKLDLAALGPEILESRYESWTVSYDESDDGYRPAGQYTTNGPVVRAHFPSGRVEVVTRTELTSGITPEMKEKGIADLRRWMEREIAGDQKIVEAIDKTPPHYSERI